MKDLLLGLKYSLAEFNLNAPAIVENLVGSFGLLRSYVSRCFEVTVKELGTYPQDIWRIGSYDVESILGKYALARRL